MGIPNIGDVEVEIRAPSDVLEYREGGGRTSLGTVRHVRPAIIESALRLAQYCGYLQLPDARPVGSIRLTNAHTLARGDARHPPFIAADVGLSLWGMLPKPILAPKAAPDKPSDKPEPDDDPTLKKSGPV